MRNDRRQFLAAAGALGAAAATVLPGQVWAQLSFREHGGLTRDEYVARIKEWFYLHNADDSHQGNLQLVEVQDAGSTKQVLQFSLVLCSYQQAVPMPSGYYRVAGERFNLFVQHTHESKGRQFYRAAFALLQ